MATVPVGEFLNGARRLLKDRRPSDYVFPTTFLEELTNAALDELVEEMGTGKLTATAWVTLVPGTDVYTVTMPTGIGGLENIENLIADSLRWPLEKRTKDEMIYLKAGTGTQRTGHPVTGYCFYETESGAITLEVDPAPALADTLTLVAKTAPIKIGSNSATGADNVNVYANQKSLTALRLRVASAAVVSAADEDLARLKLNRQMAQEWKAQSVSIALDEYWRLHQADRVGTISRGR